LLLHGKEDDTIPIESQKYFMNVMAANRISPEYLEFVEYAKVNHYITLGMLEKSKQWLDKHFGN